MSRSRRAKHLTVHTTVGGLALLASMLLGGCSGTETPASGDTGGTGVSDSGGTSGQCGTGQTACASGCVDLTSDAANCGACGTVCTLGQACAASKCSASGTGGGSASGGSSGSGGNSAGGTAAGGTGTGGSAMGGSSSGGAVTGGSNAGGATGGAATGGSNTGGVAGGTDTGGSATGGNNTGGTSAGGNNTGGSATGGSNSGGAATGGSNTGGATGGTGTGGSATGGDSGTPGVRIVGRSVATASGTRFEWSGVSIQARFTGTQVSIQLNDGGNKNEFEVVIDGETKAKLVTSSGKTSYQLATELPAGTHDLVVWRRTEAKKGATEFLGLTDFGSGGELLAPAPAPDRRLEVIGDSISCGAGIEGSGSCDAEAYENSYLAYGSVAARALEADLHTIAWSGIGMYRNYDEPSPSTPTMPQRYDYAIPTDSTAWDFSEYQPDAVIINLSSNDYSTSGDPGQAYVTAYVNFVNHVREKYPNAYILCVYEWSTSGPNTQKVVDTVQESGFSNISAFDLTSAGGSGCSGHPNVDQSKAMGDLLAAEIKRLLSW